jgi:hypothetical protein
MASRGRKKKKSVSDTDSDVVLAKVPSVGSRLVWHPGTLMLALLGIATALFGPRLRQALPDLDNRPEYLFRTEDLRITDPPGWVPNTFQRQVIREGGLPETLPLLDDRVVDQIAAAFQKNPWVERVISVRKQGSGEIFVELEYRRPVGIVVIGGDRYPIDKNATLLPPEDSTYDLPVIQNVRSNPPPSPGVLWRDRIIEGAARMADVLAPSWNQLQLKSIEAPDVRNAEEAADAVYELRSAGGSRIIWGRAPGTNHPGELTPEQKVGRLEEYQARHGGFSDEHGPYEIDIRHWQEITRLPLRETFDSSPQ